MEYIRLKGKAKFHEREKENVYHAWQTSEWNYMFEWACDQEAVNWSTIFKLRIHFTACLNRRCPIKMIVKLTWQAQLINQLLEHIFIGHCLCFKHYSVFWRSNDENNVQELHSYRAYILVGGRGWTQIAEKQRKQRAR